MATAGTKWDPDQYNRFAAERELPYWDLIALIEPVDAPKVVDLGCGDGRLTAVLHRRLGASEVLGIDSSDSMLERAADHAHDGLRFQKGDIGQWRGSDLDVVFANASLQWVDGHAEVLTRWRRALRRGGQLAVQVPCNADHPSQTMADDLGDEWLGEKAPPNYVSTTVLNPESYAQLLEDLGFERQHVRLQVYGHHLESTAAVVEWMKGTALTRFRGVLDDQDFDRFVEEYRRRLVDVLGDRSPYFYPFKRILFWGRLPA